MPGQAIEPREESLTIDAYRFFELAVAFRERLEAIQASIPREGWEWYPYDSFGFLELLRDLLKDDFRFPLRLSGGGRVLDIGCADGALAFFWEEMGCDVTAIDFAPTNFNRMRGVHALKAALGSRVEIRDMNLDSAFELPKAKVGLALLLGLLYHLKNPFYVLEKLARHSQYCLLSTRVAQVTPSGVRMAGEPVAYLLDPAEANGDPTNYWIFSETSLMRLLSRSGWSALSVLSTGARENSDPVRSEGDERIACLLQSRKFRPFERVELRTGWFALEANRWRWTAAEFSLSCFLPMWRKRLRFEFNLPEVFNTAEAITVRAILNGVPLPPQRFDDAGRQTYCQELEHYVRGDIHLSFTIDPPLRPSGSEMRELGVIVAFGEPPDPPLDSEIPLFFE